MSTAPIATLRLPQSSPGLCSVARREAAFGGSLFGARLAAAWLRSAPERDEAERCFALGFFVPRRRRPGGRPPASPPALPPLDGLAMTASCRRGQGEPTEDQRATNQREGEQVRTGEGQLAVTGRGRSGCGAVTTTARSTTVAAASIAAVVATLAAGTLGAAAGVTGRGGRARESHGVALGTGGRRLEQRRIAGDEREHRQCLTHTVRRAGLAAIGVVGVAHGRQQWAERREIGVRRSVVATSSRQRNASAAQVDDGRMLADRVLARVAGRAGRVALQCVRGQRTDIRSSDATVTV